MNLLAELIDLVLPASCVCCGRPGAVWCGGCQPGSAAQLVVPAQLAEPVPRPPTFAVGEYADELRTALLHYKERGRRQLAPQLADYLTEAVEAAVRAGPSDSPAALVPVPSRRAAARARGGDHVLRLARIVGRHARLPVLSLLELTGPVNDSAGLKSAERRANLAGRMRARPVTRHRTALSTKLILLDDIVTTGTTLAEAARALTASGWSVTGAAVLAATRLRSASPPAGPAPSVGSVGRHQIQQAAGLLEPA